MNVLFHIDQKERWPMVLANVNNMLHYGYEHQEEYTIEIVVNGKAVQTLVEQEAITSQCFEDLQKLSTSGVILCACRNALRSSNISLTEICNFVNIVDAAVIELAKKQQAGYAYIKP